MRLRIYSLLFPNKLLHHENTQLKKENNALRSLIIHAHIHSNYRESGKQYMTTDERALWDSVWEQHRDEVIDEIIDELG